MTKQSKAQHRHVREQRLTAALRENLKRRKAQARGRSAGADAGSPVGPDEPARSGAAAEPRTPGEAVPAQKKPAE